MCEIVCVQGTLFEYCTDKMTTAPISFVFKKCRVICMHYYMTTSHYNYKFPSTAHVGTRTSDVGRLSFVKQTEGGKTDVGRGNSSEVCEVRV